MVSGVPRKVDLFDVRREAPTRSFLEHGAQHAKEFGETVVRLKPRWLGASGVSWFWNIRCMQHDKSFAMLRRIATGMGADLLPNNRSRYAPQALSLTTSACSGHELLHTHALNAIA